MIASLRRAGATVIHRYRTLPYVLAQVGPDAVDALAADPSVAGAQRDVAVPPALNSTIPLIGADDALGLGFDGDGQAVAVLDSGIDADHPFFGDPSRVIEQACFSNAAGRGHGDLALPQRARPRRPRGAAADVEQSPECLDEGDPDVRPRHPRRRDRRRRRHRRPLGAPTAASPPRPT